MIDRLKKYLSQEDLPEEELVKMTEALLAAKEDYALKEKWQNTLKDKRPKSKANYTILWLFLLLALLAGLYFVFAPKAEVAPMQYAVNYIEESPYPIPQSRGNTEKDISLLKAADAYQEKDYKTAIKYYEDLLDKKMLAEDEQFYLALSLLNDGALQKSLKSFEGIEQSKSTSFQFDTELKFFLGLNYILLEQDEKALRYLKQVQGTNWERTTIENLIEKLNNN